MSHLTAAQAVEARTVLGLHAAAQNELSRARERGFTADDLGRYSDLQREIRARENAMRSRWWPTADHVNVSTIDDGLTVLVWSGDDADVLTAPVEAVEVDPAPTGRRSDTEIAALNLSGVEGTYRAVCAMSADALPDYVRWLIGSGQCEQLGLTDLYRLDRGTGAGGRRMIPTIHPEPAHGHAYVCKQCGQPSPVGIGYPAPDLPAVVSAGLTSCACGWSREPCVPCHGCDLPHTRTRMVGGYCRDCSHLIEGDQ